MRRKLRGMRDYFAVLGEPRQPWLDLEKLDQRYRELSLTTHPDRLSGDAPGDESFAAVSEAYRVLKDPKQRIQHLLQLEGLELGKDGTRPADAVALILPHWRFHRPVYQALATPRRKPQCPFEISAPRGDRRFAAGS